MQKISGKLTVPSIGFSSALLSKIWSQRNHLNPSEKNGLLNFTIMYLSGHTEFTISTYLNLLLSRESNFRNHFATSESSSFENAEIPLSQELMILNALKEKEKLVLSAPFEKLKDLCKSISNKTLEETVGKECFSGLNGLFAFRNIIAHGRNFSTKMDWEYPIYFDENGMQITKVNHTIEHSIHTILNNLKEKHLIATSNLNETTETLVEMLYKESVILHYYNVVSSISRIYEELVNADEKITPKITFPICILQ